MVNVSKQFESEIQPVIGLNAVIILVVEPRVCFRDDAALLLSFLL